MKLFLQLRLSYEENREAIENKEQFIAKRDNYAQAQRRLQKEQKKCESMLQEYFIEKGSTQQAIAGYEDQKRQLEDKEREFIAHDLFLQCMHPNGIAYNVIRQMLPIINEEIAKVLTSIVDFEVFFVDNGKSLTLCSSIQSMMHDLCLWALVLRRHFCDGDTPCFNFYNEFTKIRNYLY